MSESTPTPGPWIAEPKGGRGSWIKGSNGEWAALSCGDTDESADANARLIAAAPAMYAALKAVVAALNGRVHSRAALHALALADEALRQAAPAEGDATRAADDRRERAMERDA